MHKNRLSNNRRQALAATALLLATFTAAELRAQEITLPENQRVGGNLDADGTLGWGRTPDGLPAPVAAKLRYFPATTTPAAPSQLAFDATEADAAFTWNDDASENAVRLKMKLDPNNLLSLYKTDGTTEAISLAPDSGAIKLSVAGGGLFNATGGGVLQIDASGRPYFPTKPIFQQGIDFGTTGGTLDGSKVDYLQDLLTGFGYDPNAGSYTDISTVVSAPNLSITRAVMANGYLHWTGFIWGPAKIGGNYYDSEFGRYLIGKSNPDGSVVWVRQIQMAGTGGSLSMGPIAVNATGTVVVGGGITGSTLNLSPGYMTSTGTASDGFVLVLNSSGTPQWSKVISTNSRDDVYGVAIDASGNIAAAGRTEASGINFGSGYLPGGGGYSDGFVAKYTSSGTLSWAAMAGGTSADELRAVAFAPSGSVIVAGHGGTTTNLGSSNVTSMGGVDGWVAALNSSGVYQWANGIGGTSLDESRDLAVDSSGNAFYLGTFQGSTSSLGSFNKTSVGSSDVLVVGFNSSGIIQWATPIGSTTPDYAQRLVLDSSGALVASATVGGSTTTLGAYNVTGKGGNDGLVVTLNSSGTVTGSQLIGSSASDSLWGAIPIGSVSSGLFLHGNAGGTISIGDTRIGSGNFLIAEPQMNVSTQPAMTQTALSWSGGMAPGGGVAVGSNALASGLQSMAFGEGIARGNGAFAAGSSKAYGDASTAFGTNSTALGAWATAFGSNSNAYATGSFAAGSNTNATGAYSVALGGSAIASDSYAFSAGAYTEAKGFCSVAMGENNVASGYSAAALGGGFNTASGIYSTALGSGATASGDFSFAAGFGAIAQANASTVFGANNIVTGSPLAWVETEPLFVVGNGFYTQSNALTLLKNGSTTLTNRAWKEAVTADSTKVLANPDATDDSDGDALAVEGHTRLKGKVLIQPQGDLSMGSFTAGETP